jgi:hypothetical protein
MNKKSLSALTCGALVLLSLSGCEKETVMAEATLPAEIKAYVATHFPDHSVLQAVKDKDGLELTYDILLSEGVSLEFNRKKEIVDIDGSSRLPDSVIPEKILSYVRTYYPGNVITDWEKDGKNQQVELDNGRSLDFSKSGDFLRIDN